MAGQGHYWTAALLLSDRKFLKRWAPQVDAEDFPDGPLCLLVAAALAYWYEHKELLTEPALKATVLDRMDEEDATRLLRDYRQLMQEYGPDDSSLPALREAGAKWLEKRWVGRAVDEATDLLKRGKTKRAQAALLGVKRVLEAEEPPLSTSHKDWDRRTAYTSKIDEANPTNLADLDELWDGGIHPQELGVVLAGTNIGKSMVMCYLAAQAFRADKRVQFFTFELTETQIARRFAGALLKTPLADLPKETLPLIREVQSRLDLHRANFEVRSDIETEADLSALLEQLDREGKKPDVIFLDSGADLRPLHPVGRLYDDLGQIYKALRRDIVRHHNVAVWSSHQGNRETVDKARINLRQVADCFIIAQQSHLMLGFSQTEEELKNTEGEGLPKLKMFILKDTLHGSRGNAYPLYTMFGRGNGGYPGFKLINADAFAGVED